MQHVAVFDCCLHNLFLLTTQRVGFNIDFPSELFYSESDRLIYSNTGARETGLRGAKSPTVTPDPDNAGGGIFLTFQPSTSGGRLFFLPSFLPVYKKQNHRD